MERGMWACEIDAFFLFMAYLSFAYLFSFVITVMVEMPCHNLYQTFIMGVNLRPEAQGGFVDQMGYQRQQIAAKNNKSKRLSSSEEESDAETLDATIDDDAGYSLNGSGRTAAAYTQQARKKSGKLVLDDAAPAA